MSEASGQSEGEIDIVLPKGGLLYEKESLDYILCKPKLLPLKSVSLEKLEKMQKDADAKMRASQEDEQSEASEDK